MDRKPAVVTKTPLEKIPHTVLPDARKDEAAVEPSNMLTQLRSEIEGIRSDLDVYVTELDRRRHNVFDIQRDVEKHKGLIIAVGASLVALTAGLVVLRRKRRAKRTAKYFSEQRAGMRPSADLLRTHDSPGRRIAEAAVGIVVGAAIGAVKGRVQRAVSGRNSRPPTHER